jgi:hypothetical protein
MRLIEENWILSPRDLIAELECNHHLNLEWSAITGLIDKPIEGNESGLQLIIERLREQAKLQIKGEGLETPIFEVKDPEQLGISS